MQSGKPWVPIRLLRVAKLAFFIALALLLSSRCFAADDQPVPVRHVGGILHGFLVLKNEHGDLLASGEMIELAVDGGLIKSELTFHFKDGSFQQETSVRSQHRYLHVLTDHLVQKGPTFKQQIDLSLKTSTGEATVRYSDQDGKQQLATEHLDLPPNLANGMIWTALQNMAPDQTEMIIALVVATPKPRLIRLAIKREAQDVFSFGQTECKVWRYVGKAEIPGATGLVAGIAGKQPPDSHFWIVPGAAPVLIKAAGPQFEGGPVWVFDVVAPAGPEKASANK